MGDADEVRRKRIAGGRVRRAVRGVRDKTRHVQTRYPLKGKWKAEESVVMLTCTLPLHSSCLRRGGGARGYAHRCLCRPLTVRRVFVHVQMIIQHMMLVGSSK